MSTPIIPLESVLRTTSSRFGSYWDHLPENVHEELSVMNYAKQKLLNGPTELRDDNRAGSLACLSIRFALEFNIDNVSRDVTFAQVERHMRLCIATTAGLEKLITIPGSEPLLAEVAYELMKATRTNAVRHLAEHSDLNCIDRGRRGELVAALLIMQACDAARSITGRRWVSVAGFMEALLPESMYNTLVESTPTFWRTNDDREMTFGAMFKDYSMWFNHIIRIEKHEMISINHLWKFITRGAMILCATNQENIDIVLPVCDTTRNLGPDSVTAIIIQVKNAEDFGRKYNKSLYDGMDSAVTSTIFSESKSTTGAPERKEVTPKPVIRLVFALASPEPAVAFRPGAEVKRHETHHYAFTTFDIWLAGLSEETFKQIGADLEPYQALLERSLLPHDAFEMKDDPKIGEEARILRGARRRRMAPLALPGTGHHEIHQGMEGLGKKPGEGSKKPKQKRRTQTPQTERRTRARTGAT